MKKILSMLVMCALLLAMVCVSVNAATYYEVNSDAIRINVRKSTPTIDGVINPGEYDEFTGYSEWYVMELAADQFDAVDAMAKGTKWYFSWDGYYFYIGATWDAGAGANQEYEGGDYYGDYALGVENMIKADEFLGWGPGLNIVSSEVSEANEYFARLFYAISENTATGEHITGSYSDQKGNNQEYDAVGGEDFEFVYEGSIVTVEYRIPVNELNSAFVDGTASTMLKCTIVLQAGYKYADAPEEPCCWGVRLGNLGYGCDAGNTNKQHATFRLIDEAIPAGNGGSATEGTEGTTQGTQGTEGTQGTQGTEGTAGTTQGTAGTTQGTQGTTGGNTSGNNAGNNAGNTTGGTIGGNTTGGTTNKPVSGNGTGASQTADFGVVAALVSAISACGVMVAKKRK